MDEQIKAHSSFFNEKMNKAKAEVIPLALITLLKKTISENLYPHDKYQRQWFPELDTILIKKFQEEWQAHGHIRQNFLAADHAQAAELIEAMLGLPSILANHPHTLVMIYRKLIFGFIQRLHRRQEEREDILQELLSRFLADKIFRIQKKYDANFSQMPSFTSYFMVCVRNTYMDIVREGRFLMLKRDAEANKPRQMEFPDAETPLQSAILAEEYEKLEAILQLHPNQQWRIILCLKLKLRLPVHSDDVQRCFPNCSPDDIAQLSRDFRTSKDRVMYNAIVPLFNRHEKNRVQADTLRKWVESKITLIIVLLNKMHQASVYNSKIIPDLLSLFFQERYAHDKKNK